MIKQQFDQKTLLRPSHGPLESSVTVLFEVNFWTQPKNRRISVQALLFVKPLRHLICMIYAPAVCMVLSYIVSSFFSIMVLSEARFFANGSEVAWKTHI